MNTQRMVRPSTWSEKYGERHQLHRIENFPTGIMGPQRVRVYRRCQHYILQWWDPAAKGNLSDRVDGDLVAAITRAREIEERLENFRSSGIGQRKLTQEELIDRYTNHLNHRVDADEISSKTATRYRNALQHYRAFCSGHVVTPKSSLAAEVNPEWAQAFRTFLKQRLVAPNGHPRGQRKPIRSTSYILSVVRAMFAWAADADQGNLLPMGFRNPFRARATRSERAPADLFGEPDVTMDMATEFLSNCDWYQLKLFAPMLLYGLRAAEPCLIFREDLASGWFRVLNRPELGYQTKGLRDKRFPLLDPIDQLLNDESSSCGLVYLRRTVCEGSNRPAWAECTLADMTEEYQRRLHAGANKHGLCGKLVSEAGGLTYDHIDREFRSLTKQLQWPKQATLKDFRHLFSTLIENAGLPLFYRRYLMGQSPGKSAVVAYTHLNDLKNQYQMAVDRTLHPLVAATTSRMRSLRVELQSSALAKVSRGAVALAG